VVLSDVCGLSKNVVGELVSRVDGTVVSGRQVVSFEVVCVVEKRERSKIRAGEDGCPRGY